jgi:hypothetical protein
LLAEEMRHDKTEGKKAPTKSASINYADLLREENTVCSLKSTAKVVQQKKPVKLKHAWSVVDPSCA